MSHPRSKFVRHSTMTREAEKYWARLTLKERLWWATLARAVTAESAKHGLARTEGKGERND